MPILKTGKDCCGCTACYAICPKNAISMESDTLGFKYPKVDREKCVECKLCEKVCAFSKDYKTLETPGLPEPVGARLKDHRQLMLSRSGGAFVGISDWVLNKGGSVYGAGFDKDFRIIHKRAISKEQRDEFRGSKYVQSDLADTLKSIKQDLKDGKWVLFSGTPCQTSGVNSFIPEALREKLVLVDIVCHGVPSPAIWQDFVKWSEKKAGAKLTGVKFRDKDRFGWKAHKETLSFSNGKSTSSNSFTYIFYRHIMLRKSCEICHFANLRRPSDLTLADFWGSDKTDPDFNSDDRGASLLFLNTPKGQQIWNEIKDNYDTISPAIANCMQPNLMHPTEISDLSGDFEKDYARKGFLYVLKKYGNYGWRFKIRSMHAKITRKINRLAKKL